MQDEAQCLAAVFCRQKRISAACVNHHPDRLTCSILRSKRSLPPENWQLLAGAASFCRQRKTIFCKECAVEISGFGSNMLCPGHYLYVFISGNYPHKSADFVPLNFAKFILAFANYFKNKQNCIGFVSKKYVAKLRFSEIPSNPNPPCLSFSSPAVTAELL